MADRKLVIGVRPASGSIIRRVRVLGIQQIIGREAAAGGVSKIGLRQRIVIGRLVPLILAGKEYSRRGIAIDARGIGGRGCAAEQRVGPSLRIAVALAVVRPIGET